MCLSLFSIVLGLTAFKDMQSPVQMIQCLQEKELIVFFHKFLKDQIALGLINDYIN